LALPLGSHLPSCAGLPSFLNPESRACQLLCNLLSLPRFQLRWRYRGPFLFFSIPGVSSNAPWFFVSTLDFQEGAPPFPFPLHPFLRIFPPPSFSMRNDDSFHAVPVDLAFSFLPALRAPPFSCPVRSTEPCSYFFFYSVVWGDNFTALHRSNSLTLFSSFPRSERISPPVLVHHPPPLRFFFWLVQAFQHQRLHDQTHGP